MIIKIPRAVIAWAARRRIRKSEAELDALSQRLGILQMGQATRLFENVPGLADMADSGLGCRNAFKAMNSVIDGGQPIAVAQMMASIDQINGFVTNANIVLDQYDWGKPNRDKMFVLRQGMRGLF